VLLALVLYVPLDVKLRLDIDNRPKFRLRLAWFFGLLDKEVKKGKPKDKKKVVEVKPWTVEKGEEKKQAKADVKRKTKKFDYKTVIEILRTKGLIKQFSRLLFRLIRCFRIRDLSAHLRVGLDNPADTGLLLAVLGPAIFFLGSAFPQSVSLQPSFADKATFEGYLNGAIRLRPIKLVVPLAGFTFSLPTLRVIRILVRSKWKRKK